MSLLPLLIVDYYLKLNLYLYFNNILQLQRCSLSQHIVAYVTKLALIPEFHYIIFLTLSARISLRKNCPYSKFFWSVFSRIQSISLRIQCQWGKIRTRKTSNTDSFHAVFVWKRAVLRFSMTSPLIYSTIGNIYNLLDTN